MGYSPWGRKGSDMTERLTLPLGPMVKNLPAMQETWVRSLGQEDLLEKGMATHSCSHTWRIPWIDPTGVLQSIGLQSQP